MVNITMRLIGACVLGAFTLVCAPARPAAAVTEGAIPMAPAATQSYVTLMFSRGQVEGVTGPSCTPVANSVTIWKVAQDLAARGHSATEAISPASVLESTERCGGGDLTLSWNDLASLRSSYGWDAAPRGNTADAGATLQQQRADSCDLLPTFYNHGYPNAWSMYSYNGGGYVDQMQIDVVSGCFAFGRAYRIVGNTLPVPSPYTAKVFSINGGNCVNASLPCSTYSAPYPYTQPSQLTAIIQSGGWAIIQGYKFVTGASSSGVVTFDCTGADPRSHWTSRAEFYCYDDWLKVVDSIPASTAVVAPDVVAAAQSRTIAGPLASISLAPAQATIMSGGQQPYSAEGYDASGHDLGSVTATTTFSVDGSGSCTGATCTATDPGAHTVTAQNGTITATAELDVVTSPFAGDLSPTAGVVGSSVTIAGSGLDSVTGVQFNGVSASFTVDSPQQITATVPSGATTGAVTLTALGGTLTASTPFTVQPHIDGFNPGTASVGATVTITGSAFTGATAVSFGGTPASFTVASYGSITATVPGGAVTGAITVTTPGGSAVSASSFGVKPVITAFTPSKATVGSSVTLNGSGLSDAQSVTFNGITAGFTVATGGASLTAVVPAAAGTGKIAVTAPGGSATTSTSFTVVPTITSFTPTSGRAGTVVTITGTGFANATRVTFAGTDATFSIGSATQLQATVPVGAKTGKIAVFTLGSSATSTAKFTVSARGQALAAAGWAMPRPNLLPWG
jgi:hypothetical protein